VLGEAARAALAAAGQSPAPAERYWRFYEDRHSADAMHRAHEGAPDLTEPLGAVQAPTLIACGAYDENLKEAQRIAAWVPPARFHLMPMTGHGSPVYRPAYVAALLAAHFGRPAQGF
jgi:pimeloyl-ACP methyl ester carboxylesterase